MNYYHAFRFIGIVLLALSPSLGFAEKIISYKMAKASRIHKALDEHAIPARYTIMLNSVDQYLPEKQSLKKAFVRGLHWHLIPGKNLLHMSRSLLFNAEPEIKYTSAKYFFGSLKENVPYNFVILSDRLAFLETTTAHEEEKFKDKLSKHYFLSNFKRKVRFAGEFYVYKNAAKGEVIVVFDNGSGTYCPPTTLLTSLKGLLKSNFHDKGDGLYFKVKNFDERANQQKLLAHQKNAFYKVPMGQP